jgi:hypothetical protein
MARLRHPPCDTPACPRSFLRLGSVQSVICLTGFRKTRAGGIAWVIFGRGFGDKPILESPPFHRYFGRGLSMVVDSDTTSFT